VKLTVRCGLSAEPCGRVLGTVTENGFYGGTDYDGAIEGREYLCPKHGTQRVDREDFRRALDAGDRVLLTYRRESRHGV
jgi:hypothetical protein